MIDPHAVELISLITLPPLLLLGLATRKHPRSVAVRYFSAFAAHKRLATISVGIAVLGIRALLLPIHPQPVPAIMDEFSYLLAADTFAGGHLTNPPHPLWMHFETFCVLSQPTYASKYPPGQGLALAVGVLLGHNPWIGVLLSVALMSAAVVWMLQGWLPPRWALLGGVLVLLRIAIGSYWMDSYWGGAVAAIGGALLYGALPRLKRYGRLRDGLLFGLGLAILANTRPYEGMLVSIPALVAVAAWAIRCGRTAARPLAFSIAVLIVTGAGMLAYNRAVTGSPWRMPYQIHEAQYAVAPLFWFQELRPEPVYHHPVMRAVWTGGARDTYLHNFQAGLIRTSLEKMEHLWTFFLGPLLTVPLLALPWALRQKRFRVIYLAIAISLVGMLLEIDVVPHYAAPATALFYLVVVQCLRHLRASGWAGRAAANAIPMVLTAIVVLFYGSEASGATFLREHYSWCFAKPGYLQRARILRQLEMLPGRHLVIMHYGPHHEPYEEWVQNHADIDSAKVVWAREMDPARNHALVRYFSSRRVWLLDPDAPNPTPQPYLENAPQLSLVSKKP
jgi:hypothetical protein